MKTEIKSRVVRVLLTTALTLPLLASGATHVWSGGSINDNWSSALNWSAGGVPGAGEANCVIEFPNAFTGPTTNNISGLQVDAIRFLGSGVTVHGTAGITLMLKGTAGTNLYSAGINYIMDSLPVVLQGTNRVESPVLLGLYTPISGSGGLETRGNVRLDGEAANTYSGYTTVKSGTLTLGKEVVPVSEPLGLTSVTGPLVIEQGTVLYAADNGIGNTTVVEIRSGGTLDLNGHNDTVGGLIFNGGAVVTENGVLTLNGGVSAIGNGALAGKVSLGGITRVFDVAATQVLNVAAAISSGGMVLNGGLTKAGEGHLVLSNANSYVGSTWVQAGTLDVRHNSALGGGFIGGVNVASNATLALLNGLIVNRPLAMNHARLFCNGTASWVGPISVSGDCKFQSYLPGHELALTGVVSGNGTFNCIGYGRVNLAGTNSNTFTGLTSVLAGYLFLNKTDGATAIAGDLSIGGLFHTNNADVVYAAEANQFATNAAVTVLQAGKLILNNGTQQIGDLTLAGGEVDTANATLILNGDVDVLESTEQSRVSGKLSLGSSPRIVHVEGSDLYPALEISARVSGTGSSGILKTGAGALWLSSSNSYPGLTTVAAGELIMAHAHALGDNAPGNPNNGTVVESGGTLSVFIPNTVVPERLTLAGSGSLTNGALHSQSSAFTWAGPITLAADATINVPGAAIVTMTNSISGPGGLTKIGAGTLRFTGFTLNTYTGATLARAGRLELAKPNGFTSIPGPLVISSYWEPEATVQLQADQQIANHEPVTVYWNGTLDLNGHTEYVQELLSFGPIELGGGELALSKGQIFRTINGTGKLRALNPEGVTIHQPVAYTGETFLDGGSLGASGLASSTVWASPGTTLFGSNTFQHVILNNATLSPGLRNSLELAAFMTHRMEFQSLTMTNGAALKIELRGNVGGVSYDQIWVDGAVNLDGTTLEVRMGYPGAANTTYILLANAGSDPIQGTFAGKPEGSTFNVAGAQFQITYQGGDGNDILLTQQTASTNNYDLMLFATPVAGTNQMRLSWPTFAPDHRLQRCTNLAVGYWQDYWANIASSNDLFHAVVPTTGNQALFRLFRP